MQPDHPTFYRLAEAGRSPEEIAKASSSPLPMVLSWMKRHGYLTPGFRQRLDPTSKVPLDAPWMNHDPTP